MVVHAYPLHASSRRRGVGLATVRATTSSAAATSRRDGSCPISARAFAAGVPAELRQSGRLRPWQHVLDALAGYLTLAERLAVNPASFSTAWVSARMRM